MPVIAVVNRKGGSGKSTLATHVASYWAKQGISVMLGDIDRQQSSRTWLGLRPPNVPRIVPWAVDNKSILRVPTGVTHVVLDTPGGLHGFDLAKVVMFADVILMPIAHSIFDLSSAAQCFAELKSLPRILNGKCKVGVVGMRVDNIERADDLLHAWSSSRGLPYLGSLRKSQNYVNAVEAGLTLFDLPANEVRDDMAQWTGILQWLDPISYNRPQQQNTNEAFARSDRNYAPHAVLRHDQPTGQRIQGSEQAIPGSRQNMHSMAASANPASNPVNHSANAGLMRSPPLPAHQAVQQAPQAHPTHPAQVASNFQSAKPIEPVPQQQIPPTNLSQPNRSLFMPSTTPHSIRNPANMTQVLERGN